jgi:hypothetical protein
VVQDVPDAVTLAVPPGRVETEILPEIEPAMLAVMITRTVQEPLGTRVAPVQSPAAPVWTTKSGLSDVAAIVPLFRGPMFVTVKLVTGLGTATVPSGKAMVVVDPVLNEAPGVPVPETVTWPLAPLPAWNVTKVDLGPTDEGASTTRTVQEAFCARVVVSEMQVLSPAVRTTKSAVVEAR